MPLSPDQQKELDELSQLEELEKQYGNKPSQGPKSFSDVMNMPKDRGQQVTMDLIKSGKAVTGMDDPAYQAAGMVSPGGLNLTGIGKMLRKGGDALMQRAVGASKIIPGLGEQFAEQGLVGTKNMMTGQAERGLEASGKRIGELASQIPNPVAQDSVANKVAELANSKMTPSGFVRPEEQPIVNRLLNKAQDFGTAEPISGSEMAARRVTAGRAAREAGAYKMNPSSQIKSKVASAEQAGYSDALKKAYADSFPEAPTALADADKQYSVLSTAASHLGKPESAGGLKSFLGQFTPTSLMESSAGRAMIGTGKAAQKAPIGAAPGSVYNLQRMLKPNSYSSEDR